MTKAELIDSLVDIPDDAPVCVILPNGEMRNIQEVIGPLDDPPYGALELVVNEPPVSIKFFYRRGRTIREG